MVDRIHGTPGRGGDREYTKRFRDLCTVGEASDLAERLVKDGINHAVNRYERDRVRLLAERIATLEARLVELERPWYRGLRRAWRALVGEVRG